MPSIEHVGTVWGRAFNVMVDHGEGVYLIDTEGRRYFDFAAGIGVTSTGHAHPRVAQAIADQATKLIHGKANIVYRQPVAGNHPASAQHSGRRRCVAVVR